MQITINKWLFTYQFSNYGLQVRLKWKSLLKQVLNHLETGEIYKEFGRAIPLDIRKALGVKCKEDNFGWLNNY